MSNWVERKLTKTILEIAESKDDDKKTHVFYITSGGGEGKTILLRQIGKALGSEDGIRPYYRWSGILDLYHSDVNTNSGLESRLMDAFSTSNQFKPYQDQRTNFSRKRKAGILGTELETDRAKMSQVFAECMNHASEFARLVIAFDTTERLQYEIDDAPHEFNITDETATVRDWLIEQLGLWENCVVLLVGRPEDKTYLTSALTDKFTNHSSVIYKQETLGGFVDEEKEEYLKLARASLPDPSALDDEFFEKLAVVTDCSPIRLNLALEVIHHGLGLNKFREKVLHDTVESIRKEIDKLLIDCVIHDDRNKTVRELLKYLAIAKKGMDRDLIEFLTGNYDKNIKDSVKELKKRFYVKNHPDDEKLFLHDEMYKLLDMHWLTADEVQSSSQRIAKWYETKLNPSNKTTVYLSEKKKQEIQVEAVWYRLRASPSEGYHLYQELADPAIRASEVGYDLRLKNEIIAFLQSQSIIDQKLLKSYPKLHKEYFADAMANLIKRLMVRGRNDEAIRVAEEAFKRFPEIWDLTEETKLAKQDALVYFGQSIIYSGQPARGVLVLESIITELEGGKKPVDLAGEQANSYMGRRRNLILGRAHNNLGYVNWVYLGHLAIAIEEFKNALPYFEASDLDEEIANTRDNMARVFAILGHATRARKLVNEALETRRRLKRDYREALSLVSQAIVLLEFNDPYSASTVSRQALVIFEKLNSRRGEGLALIALGRSLRGLAKKSIAYPLNKRINFLRQATDVFEKAIAIFQKTSSHNKVNEPIRLLEAINELGCTLRDQALLNEHKLDESRSIALLAEACKTLEDAFEIAQNSGLGVWIADTCEDLAETYLYTHELDKANFWLNKAESVIPPEYFVYKDSTFVPIEPEKVVELYWAMLGKNELVRADMSFWDETNKMSGERDKLHKSLEHYMLAAIYFEQFSKNSYGLKLTLDKLFDKMKNLSYEDFKFFSAELRAMANSYRIDSVQLEKFYEDTFGFRVE